MLSYLGNTVKKIVPISSRILIESTELQEVEGREDQLSGNVQLVFNQTVTL